MENMNSIEKIGGIEVSAMGVTFAPGVTFEQWQEVGLKIGQVARCALLASSTTR